MTELHSEDPAFFRKNLAAGGLPDTLVPAGNGAEMHPLVGGNSRPQQKRFRLVRFADIKLDKRRRYIKG